MDKTTLTTAEVDSEDFYDDAEVETTSRLEYIMCAHNSIDTVLELDEMLMDDESKERKRRIIYYGLRIMDDIITEMYNELFDDEM